MLGLHVESATRNAHVILSRTVFCSKPWAFSGMLRVNNEEKVANIGSCCFRRRMPCPQRPTVCDVNALSILYIAGS